MNRQETRNIYEAMSEDVGTPFDNWEITMRELVIREAHILMGSRNSESALLLTKDKMKLVTSTTAAELFPDRTPPELLIALTELEDHDDIRKRHKLTHPFSEPRILGNIVSVQGLLLFTIDSVIVGIGKLTLPTKKNINEVIEILLNLGYIPVDPIFHLITPVDFHSHP
jgi:hypothetical protein